MAVTLDTYAPFDSGPGADSREDVWRKFMRHVLASGVLANTTNQLEVFADSTGLQVKVRSGECWIQGHWGESLSTIILPIATPHATLTRKDLVVARADFVNNRIELAVRTGTAAASPVLPTPDTNTSVWEIELAGVTVDPSPSTTIAAGKVMDRRLKVGIAGGSVEYKQATLQTISSTGAAFTKLKFDTSLRTSADVTVSGVGNTDFKIKRAGVWTIDASVVLPSAAAGLRRMAIILNSSGRRLASQSNSAADEISLACSKTRHFDLDDEVSIGFLQISGGNLDTAPSSDAISVTLTWISDA